MNKKINTGTKQWQTPELTTLVRSNPEEAVLTGCKVYMSTSGPSSTQGDCYSGNQSNCGACSDRSSS
jgi:hypothetical protein